MYAGQQISYLTLAAGQTATFSLADCNPGATGTGGGAGTGGTGGPTTVGSLGNADGGPFVGGVAPDVQGCGCCFARGGERRGALSTALIVLAAAAIIGRRRFRR
jgi:hypothetical protein